MERFADNAVGVHGNPNLLEHGVDVGVELGLATFGHEDDATAAFLDVAADVLQFLRRERQSGASEQQEVRLLEVFQRQLLLVDLALVALLELLDDFLVALGRIQHLFLRRVEQDLQVVSHASSTYRESLVISVGHF